MRSLASLGIALLLMLAVSGCGTLESPAASPGDQKLAADVLQRLQQDPVTGRALLSASAQGGVVTLRGYVPEQAVRIRALGIALAAPGVSDVVDRIQQ